MVIFDSDITYSNAYVNVLRPMVFVERYQELRGMNDDKNVRTTRPVFHTTARKRIQPRAPREAQEI